MKPRRMLTGGVVGWAIVVLVWSAGTEGKTLPVPLVTQERDQWCWAAVSQSALGYNRVTVSQCEIAEYTRSVATWHNFGSTNCCVNPDQGCNFWNYDWGYAGSIQDILAHWGPESFGRGVLSKDDITVMIFWDQCFIIRWGWSSGGGHFVVGRGFDGTTLEYMDPWYGEGYKAASYEWVVSGGGHTWTETLHVPANCDCWAVNQCCNGCMALNDGGQCDDGNACTRADSCSSGKCRVSEPVVCAALDQCHDAGVCDPGTGCPNPSKGDNSPCNDGNACSTGDSCQGGTCVGGAPVVCAPLDQCHEAGICDPGTGVCSNPPKGNGSPCDDGNGCTSGDSCQEGICASGGPVVCTPLDRCHEAGTCEPSSGACTNPVRPDGSGCDDSNACTGRDVCQGGVCSGGEPVVCAALDQCHDAGVCEPLTGNCSNPPKGNGSPCDDGDGCTGGDSCQEGACVSGAPMVCAALDQCHDAGVCDPLTGGCSNPPKADGLSCDDSNACTRSDVCLGGACNGTDPVVCTPLDQCHDAGVCDPLTGSCSNPPKGNSAPCDDGDGCTRSDSCVRGVCVGEDPVVCAPLDQCHDAGVCEPLTGSCSNPPKADGSSCNDGNACTGTDSCQGGSCRGADAVVCAALDQCHDTGVCDPLSGSCSNPPKADGTPCDDGDVLCSNEDACLAGVCLGRAVDCDDFDPCTSDICEPGAGCMHDALPDGFECGLCRVCRQASCVAVEDCVGVKGGCGCGAAEGGGKAAEMGAFLFVFWIAFGLARRRRSPCDGQRVES